MLTSWLLLACTPPTPFPRDTQRWTEVSLSAQGDARVQTEVLRETHLPDEGAIGGTGTTLGTRVLRTQGEVQIGAAEPLRFDSGMPRPGDPWVLRWQHAVSAVPAVIELDASGRPRAMVDEAAWRSAVTAAVRVLPALPGAEPPIEPATFVADLTRSFPGRPPEGAWHRVEPIAGVEAARDEVCQREGRRDGAPLWRCEGSCQAVTKEGPQLYEAECWTEVWYDRTGLVGMETGYVGTRVWMEGGMVSDAPVAGQQLLVRTVTP